MIGLNRKYKGSLMAKHYVLALLCIMAQIIFNPAWAEVTSPTTVTSTTSQDAIQTFVKSDFSTRRAMLNQWPASIEQLDQLGFGLTTTLMNHPYYDNTWLFAEKTNQFFW